MQAARSKTSFLRRTGQLAQQAFSQWSDDNATRLAAALSYYTVLSMAPLLVLSVAIAEVFVGQKAADGQLAWELRNVIGGQAALAIQTLLNGAHQPTAGALATGLSLVTLTIGASSVIVELHDALNLIWGVPAPAQSNWRTTLLHLIKERFVSALIVIGAGLLLFVSLLLSAFLEALDHFLRPIVPAPNWTLHWATFGVSFVVVTVLFGAVYKLIPDVRLTWADVAMGAAVTSLLFTIGKQLIAIYLGRVGFQSTYGAAWVGVLLLVWVYYSAQLFFLGAEFTKVYARQYGSHASRVPEN
jgi:membrane protein